MNKDKAANILQETEDGLENAMRKLELRSLPTEELVAIAKYAVRSNVVLPSDLQKIHEASMAISGEEPVLVSIEDVNLGTHIYKTQDDDGYVSDMAEADFDKCPVCESSAITYGEPEPESFFIYRVHHCDDCLSSWEERYDLTQVRVEPVNEKPIELIKEGK